ncbi:MAG: 30S ribosomal protein S5 [Nanoarchaeota archaeon]
MTKSEKKLMFENVKRTAAAHGTLSEETAEEKAEKLEEITEELIEKDDNLVILKDDLELGIIEKETKENKQRAGERGLSSWEPKTKLGQEVKNGKIRNIDEILDNNKKILEFEIVDFLLDIKKDLALIGQAKGKFGGGKRRAWRQTQKKTMEGNVATFSAMAIVGDENGHVGIGTGKAKETLPARDKAERKAKLNIIKIKRACSSFDCDCSELHTVPQKVIGKSGSVRVILIPAPQGTGLVAAGELKKMLKLAGIKDIYTKTFGKQRTTFNLVGAGFDALRKTNQK